MSNLPTNDEVELLHKLRDAEGIFRRLRELQGSEFQRQKQLREEFPDDIVRAALALEELREKAKDKFSRAKDMWFDRQGLEQATSEIVARHKAQRFSGEVWDLCSGIGGDAMALAERGEVVAVDRNPAACLRTQWNAEVYGVSSRLKVECADVEEVFQSLSDPPHRIHIDPDRRASGRGRSLRLEEGRPSLPFLQTLMETVPGGGIKLSPAANFLGKFPDAEIELISLYGECKEATVWFGELSEPGTFRATVLPANETLAGNPLEALCDIGPLEKYLYDPDPAVVRSGLVNLLAETHSLTRLDDAEEYLTSETFCETPFVRGFEVLEELPNNERAIRDYFRHADAGEVEIKCRHVPIRAEAVRRKLPLKGTKKLVLVFVKIQGKTRAVVCRRV
jgi:hypothetical protein